MATVRDYRDLIVWQKAHQLALEVHRQTEAFPDSEKFGITNQLRRAAVSIPSNIVEGFERGSSKEFRQFLIIARGSTGEVRAQLELAKDLSYIDMQAYDDTMALAIQVHKMVNALIKTTSR